MIWWVSHFCVITDILRILHHFNIWNFVVFQNPFITSPTKLRVLITLMMIMMLVTVMWEIDWAWHGGEWWRCVMWRLVCHRRHRTLVTPCHPPQPQYFIILNLGVIMKHPNREIIIILWKVYLMHLNATYIMNMWTWNDIYYVSTSLWIFNQIVAKIQFFSETLNFKKSSID